jgi:hypothetical protein
MVTITLTSETLVLEVQGFDKVWALKSRLEIGLDHIRAVYADSPATLTWWKALRMPGTYLPGVITAGTFYQDGKRLFWDVHNPANAIVIELSDDRYDQLIVEVADPAAALASITAALAERAPAQV